ncbi:2-polyprenyl-3-methyl-5-hydroxy-6-metoxy-1,4-benzoquinol methylase [Arthrobacter pigmenti]|uniref:2-polyprenyl-3-methyl-5-hydroxy-6-metoxy-1, 4-benzoquinol methylase n=1 Tax=Arthrobacter pigmenti TaxID=271432 RepID=A0A846RQL9_9MICC|nr:class I SAM-dependent methyltransferase [Arthrobacter pigmenti]NJC21396.1 2-polyprenyl-3-methyl-5-hydroxy-6-metoxy-1,4-benzoquinol methylase [Arthrobacter pigmenti]
MFLSHRDLDAVEEMDKPGCDPATLDRTYAQFSLINRFVARWRRMWERQVRPVLSTTRTNTLLDIGSGGGDVPRAFARWAFRDGIRLSITAIDPDERAFAFANSQPTTPGLTFRRAFSSELVAEGEQYDVVTSNHVLHHLSPDELDGLLRDSEFLSTRLALHSDIERTRIGYPLFSLATLPFRGSYIREDGLTSIRRSYLASELRDVVPEGWRVERQFPFRNLLVRRA